MARHASPRLRTYLGLATLALVAALISGRPELAALAAPFLTLPLIALALAQDPELTLELRSDREFAVEGDTVVVTLLARAGSAGARDLEIRLLLPTWIQPQGPSAWRLALAAGEQRSLRLELNARRWGIHRLGAAQLTARDALGVFTWTQTLEATRPLRVYPRRERLRRLIAPAHAQLLTGSRVARQRGEGVEFADIRPFRAGDRVRRVNWRATARRGTLYVNDQHPERNADVILFLDTFGEARSDAGATLDMALRAAATLAASYLRVRDRVGLVTFGGVLHWLEPASGERTLYQILDALLRSDVVFSFVWRTLDVIPRRLLPAGALVIALTPLLDRRSAEALLDLRGRGYDLAVVECDPHPFLRPPAGATEQLARRLWSLERDSLRRRFQELGVPLRSWDGGQDLARPLEEVIAFRQHARQRQLR